MHSTNPKRGGWEHLPPTISVSGGDWGAVNDYCPRNRICRNAMAEYMS